MRKNGPVNGKSITLLISSGRDKSCRGKGRMLGKWWWVRRRQKKMKTVVAKIVTFKRGVLAA